VSSVEVERPGNKLRLMIRTARPGIVIGRKGAEIEKLKGELQKRTNRDVFIDILEVNKPELDAQLVAENIALQLEKRVGFRRAMRKAVDSALRFGCKGIKVRVSGRLNGNEIARSGVVSAGAVAAAHAAGGHRLRICRSAHHVRPYWGKDVDLSRRHLSGEAS
jgi:small subunit ribosomal protein S3